MKSWLFKNGTLTMVYYNPYWVSIIPCIPYTTKVFFVAHMLKPTLLWLFYPRIPLKPVKPTKSLRYELILLHCYISKILTNVQNFPMSSCTNLNDVCVFQMLTYIHTSTIMIPVCFQTSGVLRYPSPIREAKPTRWSPVFSSIHTPHWGQGLKRGADIWEVGDQTHRSCVFNDSGS